MTTKPTNDFRAAVLMLTLDQSHQTWIREQEYNAERGLHCYDRLIDVATGRVVASRPSSL